HERVVAEVGPAVVHVEDRDVERARVGGRQVGRLLDADVAEDPARLARRAVRHAELTAVPLLVAALEGHGRTSLREMALAAGAAHLEHSNHPLEGRATRAVCPDSSVLRRLWPPPEARNICRKPDPPSEFRAVP